MTVQASDFRLGDRITVEGYSPWKSLTPIFHVDDLIAFVGMTTGWKTDWKLYPIMGTDSPINISGYGPNINRPQRVYAKGGRENAINRLVELLTGDYYSDVAREFVSLSTIRERSIQRKADEAERERKYYASLLTNQHNRKKRLTGLKSILNEKLLDEAQTAALTETIAMLESDVAHYQKALDQESEKQAA